MGARHHNQLKRLQIDATDALDREGGEIQRGIFFARILLTKHVKETQLKSVELPYIVNLELLMYIEDLM